MVYGSLDIGNATNPYPYNATIRLTGTKDTPAAVVDNAYFLGNKVLAVFGQLSMYGLPRAVTWARLSATAKAGSTTLRLSQPVDWLPGEQIVISPTEYATSQVRFSSCENELEHWGMHSRYADIRCAVMVNVFCLRVGFSCGYQVNSLLPAVYL